jgi:hypothetical protein
MRLQCLSAWNRMLYERFARLKRIEDQSPSRGTSLTVGVKCQPSTRQQMSTARFKFMEATQPLRLVNTPQSFASGQVELKAYGTSSPSPPPAFPASRSISAPWATKGTSLSISSVAQQPSPFHHDPTIPDWTTEIP